MNRYFLFVGKVYYPMEGMRDFVDDFKLIESAKAHIQPYVQKMELTGKCWAQIYDSLAKQIVFEEEFEVD